MIKDDPDTEFLCTQGNGDFVPGPLTVCNVFAVFDNPADRLVSVGNADLQVYNGANPDVFFQHPLNPSVIAPLCTFVGFFPDLICDTFITIGYKCGPEPAGTDETSLDISFDPREFQFNGHLVGYWFNADPPNGQGDAGTWPDLQVLFLQSSVAQGSSLSGDIDIFWNESYPEGDVVAEVDVSIECAGFGGCQNPEDCDDDNACTDEDCDPEDGCTHSPTNCDDGNGCTDDGCNSDTGCTHSAIDCDDFDCCTDTGCDPASGCTHDPVPCPEGEACNSDSCMCEVIPCETNADCDDGDNCTTDVCTENGCTNDPVTCEDDGNPCTDDGCDPDTGCTHTPNNDPCDDGDACTNDDMCGEDGCVHGTPVQCPRGQSCDPASGECVEVQDPCACVDGRVTLCHMPPGNRANGGTITVGCAAGDKHLAHGDTCSPCE